MAGALAPLPTLASPLLVANYARISVQSHVVSPAFSGEQSAPLDPVEGRVAFGAPVGFETYVSTSSQESGGQWLPFPPTLVNQATGKSFASATVSADGTGEVGVSGILQSLNDEETASLFALARFETEFVNVGDSGLAELTFNIPRMEFGLVGDFDFFRQDSSGVYARVVYDRFTTSGVRTTDELFDYSIQFNETLGIVTSADLLFDAPAILDVGSTYCTGFCAGRKVEPFSATQYLALEPGDRVILTYLMFATLQDFGHPTADGQAGGHAYFGDPLDISGGSAGTFIINGLVPAPVPLPGSIVLLATALLLPLGRAAGRLLRLAR